MTRVIVVGDAMIDRYVDVDITRISPEAPVPVMRHLGMKDRPGGAGNVASNVVGMGSECLLITSADHVAVKTRFMARGQQMARYDTDPTEPMTKAQELEIVRTIEHALSMTGHLRPSCAVLSDYGKGVCTPRVCHALTQAAESAAVRVLVDPKGTNWRKYSGATLIKPNLKEWVDVDSYSVPSVGLLVTEGAEGMRWRRDPSVEWTHFHAEVRDAVDVTGAGDAVIAALAAWIDQHLDLDWQQAINFACAAANVAVSHRGTHVVTKEQIEARRIG